MVEHPALRKIEGSRLRRPGLEVMMLLARLLEGRDGLLNKLTTPVIELHC